LLVSAEWRSSMQLHEVHQGIHKRKKRKRIGRGIGSGHGKTAGKGHKGHSSRQGFKLSPLSEGGQMPLIRRVPKRGFANGAFRKDYAIVNLAALEACYPAPHPGPGQGAARRWGQDPRRRHPDQVLDRPRHQVQRLGRRQDRRGGRAGGRGLI
jgi:Ribosomal proteins 50S-L15, 50S-L18e, 60S-L27A